MAAFARIVDGHVAEIIQAADGADLGARYHPDIVAACVAILPEQAGEVREGWTYAGGELAAPTPPPVVTPTTWYVPVPLLRERLEAAGRWDAAVALLTTAQILKLATLRDGVASDDAEVAAVLTAAGADPAATLAPPSEGA